MLINNTFSKSHALVGMNWYRPWAIIPRRNNQLWHELVMKPILASQILVKKLLEKQMNFLLRIPMESTE
jgi:hypothetical protein